MLPILRRCRFLCFARSMLFSRASEEAGVAVLPEEMMRALSREPGRLESIQSFIDDVVRTDQGRQMVDEGFLNLWRVYARRAEGGAATSDRLAVEPILKRLRDFQRRTVIVFSAVLISTTSRRTGSWSLTRWALAKRRRRGASSHSILAIGAAIGKNAASPTTFSGTVSISAGPGCSTRFKQPS